MAQVRQSGEGGAQKKKEKGKDSATSQIHASDFLSSLSRFLMNESPDFVTHIHSRSQISRFVTQEIFNLFPFFFNPLLPPRKHYF